MANFSIGRRPPDEDFNPDDENLAELNQRAAAKGAGKWGMGCGVLFLTPFFLGGILGIVGGIRGMQSGEHNAYIGVLVGAIFLLVSTVMLVAFIHGIKGSRVTERIMAAHPDQPWLWREDWADGFVKCEGKAAAWVAAGFALVWNAISWGALFAAWKDIVGAKDKGVYLVLLFPAVGLGLIWWAVYAVLKHRKFGVSKFRMLSNPGVLGGTLRGAVEIPVQVSPKDGFRVRLLCVHRYTTGSGKNRSTHEDTQWEDEKIIKKDLLHHDRTRTGVPVFFNIPYDLPQTCGALTYIWKLQISADIPGIDYSSEFHVPVFKTADSDPESTPVDDPTTDYQPNAGRYQWPENDPIQLRDSGDFVEVYFPPARNKGLLAFLFLFLAIWNVAIWFMIQHKAPILFPIVFGFFDLMLLIFFFSSLFYSSRINAGPTGLRMESAFLIPVGTRQFSPDQIKEFGIDSNMSSGDQKYYFLKLTPHVGPGVTLANGIRDKKQAQWLADRISAAIGLKKDET